MSTVRIYHGDCLDVLATLPAASIDACVTDPPYGIGFMGKEWDTFKPGEEATRIVPNAQINSDNPNLKGRTRGPASSPSAVEYDYSVKGLRSFQAWVESWAREVLRVLKPGGHAVVCGAPRAYHRMACGLEDAGFEIRDCLAWLFGQGFPKSLNLGDGLGTALKPAHEPIVLARKPFRGSVAANVQQHGTGALNIDACRIGTEIVASIGHGPRQSFTREAPPDASGSHKWNGNETSLHVGRWPANVCLDERAALVLDEQSGDCQTGKGAGASWGKSDGVNEGWRRPSHAQYESTPDAGYGDSGGASRFMYVAKPSRDERDQGCYALPVKNPMELTGRKEGSAGLQHGRAGTDRAAHNYHPTVKPIELMRWLVKLITPIDGTVIDPLLGSGTTGMACRYELRHFIGIEREAEYIAIAERRIASVAPLFAEPAQVKEADDVPPLVGSLLDLA